MIPLATKQISTEWHLLPKPFFREEFQLDLSISTWINLSDTTATRVFIWALDCIRTTRFQRSLKPAAFWGYGFGDKTAKYGIDFSLNVHKRSESVIRLDAYYKAIASGGVAFFDEKYQVWNPNDFYKFFTKRMNMTLGAELAYSFRLKPLRDFKWHVGYACAGKKSIS